MLKRYSRKIVKNELSKENLKALDHYNITLSELYVKEKLKHNKLLINSYSLKCVIETLKKEILKQKLIFDNNNSYINELVQQLNNVIQEQNSELSKLYNTISYLRKENKELSKMDYTIRIDENGKIESLFNKQLNQENKELKKELNDSKNGLNGANDIIKNMKNENKELEEKLSKISCLINPVSNTSNYGLLCTIDTIRNILKES